MTLEIGIPWSDAAAQTVRAVRGPRSQVAFSRRLGYRSNVAADWEGGHRAPTAAELLRAMERVGIDVDGGFARFHAASAPLAREGLPGWLDALRGQARQGEIAARAGLSRHQVRRWLAGEAEPRLPDWLRLVHALTGRAPDWVASFVPIDQVPALSSAWRASSRLAFEVPWASALRVVIGTEAHRDDAQLAEALGIGPEQVARASEALIASGLAARVGDRLVPTAAFTAEPQGTAQDRAALKAHWSEVAAERQRDPRPDDLVSLNLIAVSRADLARVRDLQRAYFRELRGLVAASSPQETAALVLMQVVTFG